MTAPPLAQVDDQVVANVVANVIAHVDDQPINVRDRDDLLRRVETMLDAETGFTLFTLNLDHLVKRRQSAAFRALYARATLVTADGWPVVKLARRTDPGVALTTGADMVIPLCRLAARKRMPVYLYGSREAILGDAATRLRALCPGLAIVGLEAPPFGFDPTSAAGREAAARIGASGARLCFVALGAPKQESFADVGHTVAPATGFVCIGAALDFIAGAQRRAPAVVQRLRLEWAWRLIQEPRRLAMRYLRCGFLFARLALRASAAS